MANEKKPVMVDLKSIPGTKDGKSKTQSFPIDQANEILKLKKSAWKLADSKFKFNGIEIAKA
jgi:hypothetical protein